MPPETKSVIPAVFYRTLSVEGLEIFYREAGLRDAPIKEIFPVQSSIFSTWAVSRWKKKWIGLGR